MIPGIRRFHAPGCVVLCFFAACPSSASAVVEDPAKPTTLDASMSISVQSPAFKANAAIPKRFTGDAEDVSPPLTWTGVPSTAKELALICDDPDVPSPQPWVHWVIYKISASAAGLPEHVAGVEAHPVPAGASLGKNSWGTIGYRGPAPPKGHGTHHYHFRLYALDTQLHLEAGSTKEQLLAAMKGHIVAQGELIGTYQR